jgi:5'-3' exoribonuclease 1
VIDVAIGMKIVSISLQFLFRMIKPKKVFFMAIDGVAPRAKMNQQRARRFRAGQDRTRKLKGIAEKSGKTFEEIAAQHFDTNAITPGIQQQFSFSA